MAVFLATPVRLPRGGCPPPRFRGRRLLPLNPGGHHLVCSSAGWTSLLLLSSLRQGTQLFTTRAAPVTPDDDERRLLGSISARCTPDPSLPSRTPSSDRPMGVGHSVVHARWPPSPAATAPHLPRLSTAPRLPSSASVTLTGTRSSASFRSLNCSPSLTPAACVAFFLCRLQIADCSKHRFRVSALWSDHC